MICNIHPQDWQTGLYIKWPHSNMYACMCLHAHVCACLYLCVTKDCNKSVKACVMLPQNHQRIPWCGGWQQMRPASSLHLTPVAENKYIFETTPVIIHPYKIICYNSFLL